MPIRSAKNSTGRATPPGSSPEPTAAQRRLAAQRALAAASGARAAQRRRLLLTVVAPVTVAVLVVLVLVVVKVAAGPSHPKSGTQASAAGDAVSAAVTGVPASVLNSVGKGTVAAAPKALTGAALSADGKPRVLFVGAEWCPYCAAERWPLAVALARFGTLNGLGQVSSSPSDVDPNTPTLSFHGASYRSDYLSLTAKELCSNQVASNGPAACNGYAALDSLDAADEQIYTSNGGGYPFLDVGGKYLFAASYDPATLQGKTQAQVAAALSDPSSSIAKAVDGSANVITAAICASTGNKPANVCTAAGVTAAAAVLPSNG